VVVAVIVEVVVCRLLGFAVNRPHASPPPAVTLCWMQNGSELPADHNPLTDPASTLDGDYKATSTAAESGTTAARSTAVFAAAVAEEQQHLDRVVERLAARIASLRSRVGAVDPTQTHIQLAFEAEVFARHNRTLLRNLELASEKVCFGRIDLDNGTAYRLGRIGLTDTDQEPLLVDWRAPVAASFYQASATNPQGLRRRRHLSTAAGKVIRVSDDVFDDTLLEKSVLSEDGALFAALNADRTGRMGDIVATIQADQDRVMRSSPEGLLLIDGAPGTGKTVVALHRAAYLLFSRREQLARRGVLIIGPNTQFLRYIEEVLPSLGESHVVLSTVGDLLPGINGTGRDRADLAALKGSERMAGLIAAAVKNRVLLPHGGLRIDIDGDRLELTAGQLRSAVRFAKDHDPQYNGGRDPFLVKVLELLVDQLCELRGYPLQDPFARHDLHEELRGIPKVRRALNTMWMPLTPQKLLIDLLSRDGWLENAANGNFSAVELRTLCSCLDAWRSGTWTIEDIPLLDEAAELLGEVPVRVSRSYDSVEENPSSSNSDVDDYDDTLYDTTLAERAMNDRGWAYGHLVVDEAQELSPMAWRMLLRRVPSKSVTAVGDLAQRSTAGAIEDWEELTAMFSRAVVEQMTVNYRTPAAVMDLASEVLTANSSHRRVVRSVRDVTDSVHFMSSAEELVARVSTEPGAGTGGVIVASDDLEGRAVVGTLGDGWTLLDPAAVKGLEFDEVVVVNPDRVMAEAGIEGLYVALTRPTRRLGIFTTSGNFPPGFTGSGHPDC
jgi:DNA helicase IV